MPTYEYGCDCGYAVEVFHAIGEKPEIKCICGKVCHKLITSFYLGGNNVPSLSEMKTDLKENHGIEQVRLIDGTFKDFYQGVKRDSGRVQEEMKQNKESYKPTKVKPLTNKEADKRVAILKEKRESKEFAKRKITI